MVVKILSLVSLCLYISVLSYYFMTEYQFKRTGYSEVDSGRRDMHRDITLLCGVGAVLECLFAKEEKVERKLYAFDTGGLSSRIATILRAEPSHTKDGELEVKLYLGKNSAIETPVIKSMELNYVATSVLMDASKSEFVDELEKSCVTLYQDKTGVIRGVSYTETRREDRLQRSFKQLLQAGR